MGFGLRVSTARPQSGRSSVFCRFRHRQPALGHAQPKPASAAHSLQRGPADRVTEPGNARPRASCGACCCRGAVGQIAFPTSQLENGRRESALWTSPGHCSMHLFYWGLPQAPPAFAQKLPPGSNAVEHVVWIIQENHSFDNYFGTYPGCGRHSPHHVPARKCPGARNA